MTVRRKQEDKETKRRATRRDYTAGRTPQGRREAEKNRLANLVRALSLIALLVLTRVCVSGETSVEAAEESDARPTLTIVLRPVKEEGEPDPDLTEEVRKQIADQITEPEGEEDTALIDRLTACVTWTYAYTGEIVPPGTERPPGESDIYLSFADDPEYSFAGWRDPAEEGEDEMEVQLPQEDPEKAEKVAELQESWDSWSASGQDEEVGPDEEGSPDAADIQGAEADLQMTWEAMESPAVWSNPEQTGEAAEVQPEQSDFGENGDSELLQVGMDAAAGGEDSRTDIENAAGTDEGQLHAEDVSDIPTGTDPSDEVTGDQAAGDGMLEPESGDAHTETPDPELRSFLTTSPRSEVPAGDDESGTGTGAGSEGTGTNPADGSGSENTGTETDPTGQAGEGTDDTTGNRQEDPGTGNGESGDDRPDASDTEEKETEQSPGTDAGAEENKTEVAAPGKYGAEEEERSAEAVAMPATSVTPVAAPGTIALPESSWGYMPQTVAEDVRALLEDNREQLEEKPELKGREITKEVQLLRTDADGREVDITAAYREALSQNAPSRLNWETLLEPLPENDGTYVLRTTETDKRGKQTVRETAFSVNRFGSVYTYNDTIQKLRGNVVKAVNRPLIISEYNPDTLEPDSWEVTLTLDGKPVEPVLYTVCKSEAEKNSARRKDTTKTTQGDRESHASEGDAEKENAIAVQEDTAKAAQKSPASVRDDTSMVLQENAISVREDTVMAPQENITSVQGELTALQTKMTAGQEEAAATGRDVSTVQTRTRESQENSAAEQKTKGWNRYDYVISAENFREDGVYRLSVSSRDASGNTPEMHRYNGGGIVFTVDGTPPELQSIEGLETSEVTGKSAEVRVKAFDAIGLARVSAFVDGKCMASVAEFPDRHRTELHFRLSAGEEQHVTLVAEDIAGNTIDTDKKAADGSYLFHPAYPFVRRVSVRRPEAAKRAFGELKLLLVMVVVCTGVAAGVLWWYFRKLRRNRRPAGRETDLD